MPNQETGQWEFVQDISDFVRWLADVKWLVLVPLDDAMAADLAGPEIDVPADRMPDVLAMEYANTFEWTETSPRRA